MDFLGCEKREERVWKMENMKHTVWTWLLIAGLPLALVTGTARQSDERQTTPASGKPRVVITQDPELDDVNTVIRALLYSTDVRLEGLIYSSANFHFRGDGKGTTQYIAGREYARMGVGPVTSWRWPTKDKETWIDEIVDAYEKGYANLKIHDSDYLEHATVTVDLMFAAAGLVLGFGGWYAYFAILPLYVS